MWARVLKRDRCRNIALIIRTIIFLSGIGASEMLAQNNITINGANNLVFGTIPRNGTSAVAYESNAAAQFVVTGDTAYHVRLTVSLSDLNALSGVSSSSASRNMHPALTGADCAYSLDGGISWLPFTTGALYQDTQFPSSASATSSIYVRVGGHVSSGSLQQRGGYSGDLTLTAEYQ
jgi:hypothetical protein